MTKVNVKNDTMLTQVVSSVKFDSYTLEGGGSMSEAAILERQGQAVVSSDRLNSKAKKEIEVLLEESQQSRTKRDLADRPWYFRMPQAGVRYYSL